MEILYKSCIKDPPKTFYEGEDEDEKTLFIIRSSLITNISWVVITIMVLILPNFVIPYLAANTILRVASPQFLFILNLFMYILAFGFFFQNFLNWFFNVYIITNKKIVDMDFQGLFYKNISEAPLRNIEDVTSTVSGALRTVFNFGSVFIQTAAEKSEFEFTDIDDPSKIRDILSDLVSKLEDDDK